MIIQFHVPSFGKVQILPIISLRLFFLKKTSFSSFPALTKKKYLFPINFFLPIFFLVLLPKSPLNLKFRFIRNNSTLVSHHPARPPSSSLLPPSLLQQTEKKRKLYTIIVTLHIQYPFRWKSWCLCLAATPLLLKQLKQK